MKTSARSQRVGDQIQKELATFLQTSSFQDENFALVTFSAIHLSTNFLYARVFFTYLDSGVPEEEKIKNLANALNAYSSKFRHKLAQNLKIRVVPRLEFVYDYHLEKANKLIALIDNLQTNN